MAVRVANDYDTGYLRGWRYACVNCNSVSLQLRSRVFGDGIQYVWAQCAVCDSKSDTVLDRKLKQEIDVDQVHE